LVVSDVPVPTRKEGEVLIKVVSAGVNPVDLLVASGAYKPAAFPKASSSCLYEAPGTKKQQIESSRNADWLGVLLAHGPDWGARRRRLAATRPYLLVCSC
jgi:hypothetical protein